MSDRTTIISFTGPSGSGKSELVRQLVEMYGDHCVMWQQFTTRPRRGPGDAYVFVKPEQYAAMRHLLTVRTEFGGNLYGTMPEAGTEGKAVLTIADLTGYADLRADVGLHNENLRLNREDPLIGGPGRPTKFGSHPVELVTVFVRYEPTAERLEERGRASRGLEFVMRELEEAESPGRFFPDCILDTTAKWPDPEAFFNEVVWPALTAHSREAAARARAAAEGVLRLVADGSRPAAWCDAVAEAIGPFLAESGPPAARDAIDEALSNLVPPLVPAEAEGPAAVPEPAPAAEAPGAPPEREAPPEPEVFAEAEDRLEQMRLEALEAERAPPAPAPEAPPPEAPPGPPKKAGPRIRTLRDLIEAADFEAFITTSHIGQNAFTNASYFEGAFKRFMTENGAVFPGVLTFPALPPTPDPKDKARASRIRHFRVEHTHDGVEEIFTFDYSERLRRAERPPGMVPGPRLVVK